MMERTSRKLFKLCGPILLVLFCISIPAAAQTPVDVSVKVKGDLLYVETVTTAPEPALRMNPDPAYLELAFPNAALKGSAFSKAIDRGLVRKVVTTESGGTALARVYVLNKPKASLTKTDTGYRYTIRVQEMASAPVRTAAAPTQPVEPQPKKPTEKPVKPAQPEKPAQPKKPTQSEVPVATTSAPEKPAVQEPKRGPAAPITAQVKGQDIVDAIPLMAQQAGMKSAVDPRLIGKVQQNFENVPLERALRAVLAPLGDNVETTYAGTMLTVKLKQAAVAPPTQVEQPAVSPSQPTLVREYFPYKSRPAEKVKQAAQLAFPDLGVTYKVDPVLNILLVEGRPEDVAQLEKFLREQSPK